MTARNFDLARDELIQVLNSYPDVTDTVLILKAAAAIRHRDRWLSCYHERVDPDVKRDVLKQFIAKGKI